MKIIYTLHHDETIKQWHTLKYRLLDIVWLGLALIPVWRPGNLNNLAGIEQFVV